MLKSKFVFKSNTGIIAHLIIDDAIEPHERGRACSELCNFNGKSEIRRDPRYVSKICHAVALEVAGASYNKSNIDCDYLERSYGIKRLYTVSSLSLFLACWIRVNKIQIN